MPPVNVENDPLFVLLTDALRAGPGSASWQEAVEALRARGGKEQDEYQLLVNARENLEGGKEYRAVRAGVGFTRKLMTRIDEEKSGAGGFPTTNVIAIICGLAILGALAYLVYRVALPPRDTEQQAIEQLSSESTQFLSDVADANFSGMTPEGWRKIGALPLDTGEGLRPAEGPTTTGEAGGGLVWSNALPADQSFLVEANVNAAEAPATKPNSPAEEVTVEVFVSNSPDFTPDKATSPHEIDWLVRGSEQQVIVDGTVNPAGLAASGPYLVRVIVGKDVAIVGISRRGTDGRQEFKELWRGAHHLGAAARYAGVRFLRNGSGQGNLAIQSVRVAKK